MALLSGYSYRKSITIAGSSGAGTGYQVLLKIGESAGSSGADFHLEGHAANFPNDIRFTASDGITEYNYWIEKIEGVAPNRIAYVWIKVDESLDSDVNLYVYYGNPVAVSTSNGDATFEFFDDFEGPSVDTNKWDVQPGNGTIEITTIDEVSALHIGNYANYYSYIQAKNGINPTGKVAVMRTRIGDYSGETWGLSHAWKDVFDTSTYSLLTHRTTQSGNPGGRAPYDQCVVRFVNNNLETRTDPFRTAINPLPADVWSIWTLRIDSSSSAYAKSVIESTGTVINEDILSWTTPLPSTTYYAVGKYFANSNYTTAGVWGDHYVDYVYIRKYADPEPAFSFVGTEETQTIGVSFGIGSVIHTNYFRTNNAVLFNEINSALKNNIAQAIETNIQKQKNTSIFAQLQSMVNQKIDSDIQMRYFKQSFNSGLVENISLNSQSASKEIQVSKQDTKHVANIARLSSFILSSISALQNILNEIQKFNSLSADLETLLRKNILAEASTQNTVIQKVSSFVEIISGVLVSHNIPTLIELQSEIINHINSLKEISSAYSKQTGPIIDIGSDILQSISLALETSSELETKLSEVTEILKQITKKASTKASIDNVIKMNLNILTEIVESASELIQILRTVGEKITIFRTTIDILRHTDN
jgi:hypothetical protein